MPNTVPANTQGLPAINRRRLLGGIAAVSTASAVAGGSGAVAATAEAPVGNTVDAGLLALQRVARIDMCHFMGNNRCKFRLAIRKSQKAARDINVAARQRKRVDAWRIEQGDVITIRAGCRVFRQLRRYRFHIGVQVAARISATESRKNLGVFTRPDPRFLSFPVCPCKEARRPAIEGGTTCNQPGCQHNT